MCIRDSPGAADPIGFRFRAHAARSDARVDSIRSADSMLVVPEGAGRSHRMQSARIVRMDNLPKDTLASLPPRSISG
eukprot:7318360-Pyramimonas_sp.AAC.1